MADYQGPIPQPTPETQHYWDGCKAGQLLLQKCDDCGNTYFPPRPFCSKCASCNVSVVKASGKATLFSYIINHRAPRGFEAPFAIAVVKLAEGPTMMTNIVDCEQTREALQLDMPLEVVFHKVSEDISLPKFRPAGG